MFSGGLWFVWLVLLVVGTAGGFALGYLIKNRSIGENISQLQEDARDAVNEARTQAMTLEIEARDKSQAILQEAENEVSRRTKEISRQETRLQERRDNLDRRLDNLEARDTRLKEREQRLDARQVELDQAWQSHLAELERISGLTQEQAKEVLLKEVEEEARIDAARIIRDVEAQAHEEADERHPGGAPRPGR
jgi:ribonuclease Y